LISATGWSDDVIAGRRFSVGGVGDVAGVRRGEGISVQGPGQDTGG